MPQAPSQRNGFVRAFAPRRLWRHGRLPLFLLVAALTALRLWDPAPVGAARLGFFDLLQRWRPQPAATSPVVIVNIDEASLARLGRWPWPRHRIAELVTTVADQGAKVIGFNIAFVEPERPITDLISPIPDLPADVVARLLPRLASGDVALAAAFDRAPVVLGTIVDSPAGAPDLWSGANGSVQHEVFAAARDPGGFLQAYRRAVRNLPDLLQASAASGALVVEPDRTGVIRAAPIAVRVAGRIEPSLAAAMAWIGGGAKLELAVSPWGIEGLETPGGSLATERNGDVWLAYARPDAGRYVSAAALLAGDIPADRLRDKYVLIGTTVAGIAEYHATPLGVRMPGLEIQAQILDSVLTGRALHRPPMAGIAEIAAPIGLALLGLVLARRRRLALVGGISLLGAATWPLLALGAYAQGGVLIDPVYPSAAFLLVGAALVASEIVAARRRAERTARDRERRLRELQVEILNLSRLSAIEQMSSALAHELNQPLAAMGNFAQASLRLLQQDGLEQKAKITGYLEKTVEQVSRAAAIITGLRNLVQRGKTARAPEDVNETVAEAVETAMIGAARKVAIVRDFAAGLPPVPMNRIQIQQVVLNLVRNAAEALAEQERGAITVRTALAGDAVEISVADNGPGVPSDFERQLFKPFSTTKDTGMGIGLSISRSILQAHGGALSAERNEAGGMTFRCTLPIAPDDAT